MTTSLFTQIVESALVNGQDMSDKPFQLTAREKEIIALISEGLSNKELAARLQIATHTVKSHVHNILEKLALGSRLQIAAFTSQARILRVVYADAPPARTRRPMWRGLVAVRVRLYTRKVRMSTQQDDLCRDLRRS